MTVTVTLAVVVPTAFEAESVKVVVEVGENSSSVPVTIPMNGSMASVEASATSQERMAGLPSTMVDGVAAKRRITGKPGEGWAITVRITLAVVLPERLVAVTTWVAAGAGVVGVPEMTPVVVSSTRPPGRGEPPRRRGWRRQCSSGRWAGWPFRRRRWRSST